MAQWRRESQTKIKVESSKGVAIRGRAYKRREGKYNSLSTYNTVLLAG